MALSRLTRLLPVLLLVAGPAMVLGQASVTPDASDADDAYITLQTANFNLKLDRTSQVLLSLQPKTQTFDFLPFDLISYRSGNGTYHWGDVTVRYRNAGSSAWTNGDTSTARRAVKVVSTTTSGSLAAANIGASLPTAVAATLNITREWSEIDGDLALQFAITNVGKTTVELGGLGFPAEFNSIFTNRSPENTQAVCSLSDPYIGLHGGFIRVAPVSGVGPALVVTPVGNTPFEAYRNLQETYVDATAYGSQVFEGLYEWQVLTKGWAASEWAAVSPWNTPTSRNVSAGETIKVGVRFSVASSGVRGIEAAVEKTGTPVVRGIPGYVLLNDLPAQLLVSLPQGLTVTSTSVAPASALGVQKVSDTLYQISAAGSYFGLARLTLGYSDGRSQTVHYTVKKSGPDTLADLGQFLTTKQYFTNTSDPFGRAPSVMTYDYQAKQIVTQDDRVWIAGLSDEAGAGSFLSAAMKQAAQPNADEISRLEAFVSGVMFGKIQNADFTVRKSVFFYEPAAVPGYTYSSSYTWTGWQSWNKADAYSTSRAYDYVHVAATYWALYRAARAYPDLFSQHKWDWYLNQAFRTVNATMVAPGVGYADVGLMGETVFGELLKDLNREGLTANAKTLEGLMKTRATAWSTQAVPFGSEMAWDSTGQEGVYYWTKYFGYSAMATKALNTVLGFMPTVPHWGWNGNARRYWDNLYGGKLRRIERQIHHYGSGLNALVALSAFRSNPADTYLLQIGYAGMNGPLSNINAEGFASASFHSWPDTLAWDAYSGDYGPNFLGLVLGSATYIAQDPALGLVAYGGTFSAANGMISVQPKDAVRRKVFVGPAGVLLSVDAGVIQSVTYTSSTQKISLTLGQLDGKPKASSAILWLDRESGTSNYTISSPAGTPTARGGWQISLGTQPVVVELSTAV